MLNIMRKLISYSCVLTGRMMKHYVLIASLKDQMVLLSHANLYLREITTSEDTSNRYSHIISMFYRYLSTLEKYDGVPVGTYHALVDNEDVKNWQIQRQITRVSKQAARPSTQTIIEEGLRIYTFFAWLDKKGYPSCMSFEYKTWQPNFQDEGLLAHIKRRAIEVLDGNGVKALDREVQQSSSYSLPTNHELKELISNYHDPVYSALFKLSLGTAMRPMDLCRFPYVGNGANSHIMPYPSMKFLDETTSYYISQGKGNKYRTVKIHKLDLKALHEQYIEPYYLHRKGLYEKRYGKPCPPSILFLSSRGIPVNRKMISRRTVDARKKARSIDPSIRPSICFYDSRHWWPTMFLIKRFEKALMGELGEVRDLAAMQVLRDQMGHKNLITTYNHYVDLARVVYGAHQGLVNEMATNPSQTVSQFLESADLE